MNLYNVYRIIRFAKYLLTNNYNKFVMRCSSIKFGRNFYSCGTILFRNYGGTMILGNCIKINSHIISDPIGGQNKTSLVAGIGAKLLIGDRTGISNASIFASKEIIIGEDVTIGAGCKIYDTDFHPIDPEYRKMGNENVISKPVHIGNNVFLGGHSIILKGVTIGDDSVIGAGSVVTKNIPSRQVWAGNPAKYIKSL